MPSRPEDVLDLAREVGLLDDEPAAGSPSVVLAELLRERRISPNTLRELEAELEHRALRSPAGPKAASDGEEPLPSFDRYKVVAVLGEGGVGRVVRAFDPRLERFVALKVIRGRDAAATDAIQREAQAQARLEHPHVCKVYEVGAENGQPYIAMQLVSGPTLAAAVPRLSLEDKLQIMRRVSGALHAAHTQGLIHRDVKPGNVLVERADDGGWLPYVTDFGLARTVTSGPALGGEIVGTAPFMAPEQARGSGALDARTDVYGLGATLYALVAGRPPFVGSLEEVLRDVVGREAPRPRVLAPSLPRDVEAIIRRCLEKEPARRYASARELADDLGRFLDGKATRARPRGALDAALRRARRHPVLAGAAMVALLTAVVLGGLWVRERRDAGRRAELGQRFGRRVEHMRAIMREAHLLPLHDIRPAKARVRTELDEIRREVAESGAGVRPLGAYALGRGHLALRELDEARARLEAAWDGGQRTTDTAEALGLTLSALYQRDLAAADRLDVAARAARIEALRATYREPALRYLREARAVAGDDGPSALVAALFAYHEGRTDDAVTLARQAVAAAPGLYEASLLEGEAYLARARDMAPGKEALAELALAGQAIDRAGDAARSDPLVWERRCEQRTLVASFTRQSGGAGVEDVDEAIAACGRALEADADLATAYSARAGARYVRLVLFQSSGQDPRAETEAGIADGQAAAELAPEDPEGLIGLARLAGFRGWYDAQHGGDPIPWFARARGALAQAEALGPSAVAAQLLGRALNYEANAWKVRGIERKDLREQSIAALERSVAREPNPKAMGELARSLHELGERTARQGHAWQPYYGRALATALGARARWPQSSEVLTYVGEIYVNWAYREVEQGIDPRPTTALAEDVLETALAVNPRAAGAATFIALANDLRVEHDGVVHRDPRGDIARSLSAYDRALALRAGSQYGSQFAVARLHARLATWQLENAATAAEVRAELAASRHWAEESARTNSNTDVPLAHVATLDVLEARLILRDGGDPRAAFRVAEATSDRALAMKRANAYAMAERAELHLHAGTWMLGAGADPAGAKAAAATGLGFMDLALAIHPSLPEFRQLKGRLLLLAARAGDRASAGAAVAVLREVSAQSPSWASSLASDLATAETLAR